MFFYGKGAYESLDLSRKVIRKQWWGMFGFSILVLISWDAPIALDLAWPPIIKLAWCVLLILFSNVQ